MIRHLGGYRPETRENRRKRAMDRRGFLTRAGVVAGVAAFPAPAIAQGTRELKMVTSWPKGLPGLGAALKDLAARSRRIPAAALKSRFSERDNLSAPSRCSMPSRAASRTCII